MPAKPLPKKSLQARLARVKLFLCGVDGVLADATSLHVQCTFPLTPALPLNRHRFVSKLLLHMQQKVGGPVQGVQSAKLVSGNSLPEERGSQRTLFYRG